MSDSFLFSPWGVHPLATPMSGNMCMLSVCIYEHSRWWISAHPVRRFFCRSISRALRQLHDAKRRPCTRKV